jgi:hypothetical protein
MPDLFIASSTDIVGLNRDRSAAFERICALSNSAPIVIVYRGDIHDVQSPQRHNMRFRRAHERRTFYFARLRNCIYCGIDEDGHRYSDIFNELWNDEACDNFTRPAPLVLI